jgi:hypothetical protein
MRELPVAHARGQQAGLEDLQPGVLSDAHQAESRRELPQEARQGRLARPVACVSCGESYPRRDFGQVPGSRWWYRICAACRQAAPQFDQVAPPRPATATE